jgi:glycosyltransferase involved in cell wall biosynthesis
MISIITINFNNVHGLSKTLSSLAEQSDQNYEWILIDGNSTDGSVEAANLFARRQDTLVSEKDSGIYNAMNKGIQKSTGECIIFLNSGDIFFDHSAVQSIAQYWRQNLDLLLFGFIVRGRPRMPKPLWWRFWSLPTSHQAIVYNSELLRLNPFDERYLSAADYEHFLRVNQQNIKVKSVPSILIINEPYGCDQNLHQVLNEYAQALNSHGVPSLLVKVMIAIKKKYLGIVLGGAKP